MSQIKLKHSGGNGVIIAAPSSNPASDRTLTLPSDADGTIVSKDTTNNLANIASINNGAIGTRNLLHNGNFVVAQRAVSSTSTSYRTVDRWLATINGHDETFTQAQVDVTSGTTPYTQGFRKAYSITNGNQTSGAQSNSFVFVYQKIEAQDIANSGWNYTDTNSFITLSFWVKSSVAQNFTGYIKAEDANYVYPFETGSLSANTWTKVTKTIPGNSNLVFNNDINTGMIVVFNPYLGTDYTDSGTSAHTWSPYVSASRSPVSTTTWWTTNDATFQITGVQLEVGSTASSYAHESYGETLRKCQRYLYILDLGSLSLVMNFQLHRLHYNTGAPHQYVSWPVPMRTAPSMTKDGTSYTGGGYTSNILLGSAHSTAGILYGDTSVVAGSSLWHRVNNVSGSTLRYLFSAEL